MAETTTPAPVVEKTEDEKKPGFIARFRTNHPKKFKAALLTAGALTLGGVAFGAGKKAGSNSSDDLDFEGDESTLATDTLTGSEA